MHNKYCTVVYLECTFSYFVTFFLKLERTRYLHKLFVTRAVERKNLPKASAVKIQKIQPKNAVIMLPVCPKANDHFDKMLI